MIRLDTWLSRIGHLSESLSSHDTRTAHFVVVASIVSVLGAGSYALFSAFTMVPQTHLLIALGLYALGNGLAILLIRSAQVVWATHLVVLLNWLTAVNFIVIEGTETGHAGIFFIAIVMAGLLRGPLAAVVYGLASAAVLLSAVVLFRAGHLTPQFSGQETWTHHTPQLIVVGLLVAVLMRSLGRTVQELQSSQRALRQSQTQLRSMVDNSPDGIVMFDSGRQCVAFNPAALRILDREADSLLHATAEEVGLLHTGNGDAEEGVKLQWISTRSGDRAVEINIRHVVEDGEPAGVEMILREVTARIAAEEAARELEAQLRRAQKTEALGRLAGGVAHDFNNLLTIVIGNVGLLESSTGLSASEREWLSDIADAAERATRLTRQLLSFGRSPEKGAETVDVRAVLTDMHRMLTRMLGEKIELILTLPARQACVYIDPVQLEQVIVNLVVNAQDAMPGGGRLTITLQEQPPDTNSTPDNLPKPYIELSFSDTGAGISPEVAGNIFEPFFSTRPGSHNTGLGLSTVQLIIEAAGGTIHIDSAPGAGATFTIRLAVSSDPVSRQSATVLSPPPPPTGLRVICFVDDDESICRIAERALGSSGYAVVSGTDATAVLSALRMRDLTPDLLITDVILPSTNGVEVADTFRTCYPGLPFFFISGYPGTELKKHGISEVDSALLSKPFTNRELLSQVYDTLHKRD